MSECNYCRYGACSKCNDDYKNEEKFFEAYPDMFSIQHGTIQIKWDDKKKYICDYCDKPILVAYVTTYQSPSMEEIEEREKWMEYPSPTIRHYHQACLCKFHMSQCVNFFNKQQGSKRRLE